MYVLCTNIRMHLNTYVRINLRKVVPIFSFYYLFSLNIKYKL